MAIALELFNDAKNIKTFAAGETIFKEGESGDCMYIITDGEVEILHDNTVINKLGPGEIFGEMALIDNKPRSATVRAAIDSQVAPVNRFDFSFYVQHSPFFALDVMEIMVTRLRRQMNE